MSLKLTLSRESDGNYEDLVITCPTGEQLTVRVASSNPNKIRLEIDGPRTISVKRMAQSDKPE